MILIAIFIPPLYFLLKKKWLGFIATTFLLCFSLFFVIFFPPAVVLFWIFSSLCAIWNYKKQMRDESATIFAEKIAAKMAESMRQQQAPTASTQTAKLDEAPTSTPPPPAEAVTALEKLPSQPVAGDSPSQKTTGIPAQPTQSPGAETQPKPGNITINIPTGFLKPFIAFMALMAVFFAALAFHLLSHKAPQDLNRTANPPIGNVQVVATPSTPLTTPSASPLTPSTPPPAPISNESASIPTVVEIASPSKVEKTPIPPSPSIFSSEAKAANTAPSNTRLSVDGIMALAAAGVSAKDIINGIIASHSQYSPSEIAAAQQANVDSSVIEYMHNPSGASTAISSPVENHPAVNLPVVPAALRGILAQAQAGDAKAQCDLGAAYQDGRGIDKDLNLAAQWFRKSADQNYPTAEIRLGVMYCRGGGVEKDFTKAVALFRQAADQGSAIGQRNLGELYEHGDGVDQNYATALHWYREAAAQDPTFDSYIARILATCPDNNFRDPMGARSYAEKAIAAAPKKTALMLDVLAAALAANHEFRSAVKTESEAISLEKIETIKNQYESRLALYRSNVPYIAPAH